MICNVKEIARHIGNFDVIVLREEVQSGEEKVLLHSLKLNGWRVGQAHGNQFVKGGLRFVTI
ncbi:hypothetical protein [Actinomadura sp. HBU206391]|uniref:hypothetical protein n=1 Tax=Actinomadura sp. HBU206391 TaxID=2731692 RepID=UPI0021C81D80|nr:hypothetical protein [Actinomadura sp. HBU206391]